MKKIILTMLATSITVICSEAKALDESPSNTAAGYFAGSQTMARCNDGAIDYASISTSTNNPTFCNTHGGWLGNAAPSLLNTVYVNTLDPATAGTQNSSFGTQALSTGGGAIAIGTGAFTTGSQSTALGLYSTAFAFNSVAVGAGSLATIGAETYANAAQMNGVLSDSFSEFSIGNSLYAQNRRLTNVANGYANNDGVNVGQLNNGVTNAVNTADAYTNIVGTSLNNKYNGSLASVASVFGGGSTYNPVTGVISNPLITVSGNNYHDTTSAIQALDNSAIQYDKIIGENGIDTSNATLKGVSGTTLHNLKDGVALTDAATFGQIQTAQKNAITTSNTYTDTKIVGANNYTDTKVEGAITISNNYTDIKTSQTLIDANTYTDNKFTSATVNITNLGDSTAATIGGGSIYDPATGTISKPTITAAGGQYHDTTSAIEALDKSSIQYDKTASGGAVDTSNVTLQGVNGTMIHNITGGVSRTDAASFGQVQDAVKTANDYTDGQISNTQVQIATLGNQNKAQFQSLNAQIKSTGSIAAAMSGLVPNYQSSSAWQAQAAIGYGSGAAGVAAGTTYQISNDVLLVGKMGVSTTSGVGIANRIGGAIGVSFGL